MIAKNYHMYSKLDPKKEPIYTIPAMSRLQAANIFANIKRLSLRVFLTVYGVSK